MFQAAENIEIHMCIKSHLNYIDLSRLKFYLSNGTAVFVPASKNVFHSLKKYFLLNLFSPQRTELEFVNLSPPIRPVAMCCIMQKWRIIICISKYRDEHFKQVATEVILKQQKDKTLFPTALLY